MSVLIKGLKMPKSCEVCPMIRSNAEYDYAYCCVSSAETTGRRRPTDCPLIELPDHGDLIDRDKLIGDMKMIFGEETLVTMRMNTKGFKPIIKSVPKDPMIECLCNLAEFVKLSPVVIPAERSEDHD